MTDRGVSEVLGFVLVFAIVTATIGIVFATGFTGLAAVQQAEQFENMERAFDVLDDNLADLHRRDAPSRATEIKLSGGSLTFEDRVTLTVSVENASDPNDNASYRVNPNPVVYRDGGDEEVVYVLDATFRANDDGSVMLSDPGFIFGSDRALIPLFGTYRQGTTSVGGDQTVLIVASTRSTSHPIAFTTADGHDVVLNLTVRTPRTGAWEGYLESEGFTITNHDEGVVVSGERTVSTRVDVAFTSVDVEFEA